ncbi:MAG: hypothetical protein GY906_33415 [bacterium]|nr:hypothetical protein [bacterium]
MVKQQKSQRKGHQPWWLPSREAQSQQPIFSLHLWGLENKRLDVWLTLVLLALLVASRIVAFPASIWDQDEAYFATAVVHFDPLDNNPHPPWFPLWILLGKAFAPLFGDPARGLQFVSAYCSVWVVFPLSSLWSRIVLRPLATAAAVMYCTLPGVWMLSGRAFTEPAATALLAVAAASWFAWEHPTSRIVGSVGAGACLLVRPHFAIALGPLIVLAIYRRRNWRHTAELVIPAAVVVCLGFSWVVATAGGFGPLATALQTHGVIHFGQLGSLTPSFADSGLCRALLMPSFGVAWLALMAIGFFAGLRHVRRSLMVIAAVLVPLTFIVVSGSNPEHTRYWIPLLAFSVGFVVLGLAQLARSRWVAVGVAAALGASVIAVLPSLSEYRSETSAVVKATRFAFTSARESGGIVVTDRALVSFVGYEQALRQFNGNVILDSQIILGETVPPPPFATIYLRDEQNPGLLESAENLYGFRCTDWLLRRIGQNRFLDLEVAAGASLGRRADGR